MTGHVQPIPERYRAATPYLCIKDAARALDFYAKAFGARQVMRLDGPDGRVMHAEIEIGAAPVMLADECPQMQVRSPQSIGGSPVSVYVYVEDVDALAARAAAAGAEITHPVQDQFYGDRSVQLRDPFGHLWGFATHIEDVAEDEVRRRFEAMIEKMSKAPAEV